MIFCIYNYDESELKIVASDVSVRLDMSNYDASNTCTAMLKVG